jgi:hypothetical protein
MQLAIDLLLAHPAGDQLGDLGTEIEDEDFLACHGKPEIQQEINGSLFGLPVWSGFCSSIDTIRRRSRAAACFLLARSAGEEKANGVTGGKFPGSFHEQVRTWFPVKTSFNSEAIEDTEENAEKNQSKEMPIKSK